MCIGYVSVQVLIVLNVRTELLFTETHAYLFQGSLPIAVIPTWEELTAWGWTCPHLHCVSNVLSYSHLSGKLLGFDISAPLGGAWAVKGQCLGENGDPACGSVRIYPVVSQW